MAPVPNPAMVEMLPLVSTLRTMPPAYSLMFS
jgi:hypothetical protein